MPGKHGWMARPSGRDKVGKTGTTAAGRTGRGNKLMIVAVAVAAVAIGLGLTQSFIRSPAQNQPAAGAAASPSAGAAGGAAVVRDNSHRLAKAADGKVTLVEFLDFECESCGAVHPAIEQLRKQYEGRVTFVVRYFPLEGHFNSRRAAHAVEAAARQGQFEAMYQKMFATQKEWGEQKVPKDEVFRGYAAELGLDMTRWDADYAAPAIAARVQADVDDGLALGLTGTPSFFLNGKPFAPESMDDLTSALDAALAA